MQKAGLGRGGAEPKAIEVTFEDQSRINRFGQLNNRSEELSAELKKIKEDVDNLEDAASAVELLMDDGDCLMRYGDIFVEGTEEESVEFVEKAKKQARERFNLLDGERENIDSEMKELKGILYAKFGSSINLETK